MKIIQLYLPPFLYHYKMGIKSSKTVKHPKHITKVVFQDDSEVQKELIRLELKYILLIPPILNLYPNPF